MPRDFQDARSVFRNVNIYNKKERTLQLILNMLFSCPIARFTYVTLSILLLSFKNLSAGTTCWTGGSSTWNCACNWSGSVPNNSTNAQFDDSAGGAACSTHTINLAGSSCASPFGTCSFIVDKQAQNYSFQFQNGAIRATSPVTIDGTAVFNCGGNLITSGATGKVIEIGSSACDTGTLSFSGTTLTRGKLQIGLSGSGTFIMSNCASADVDCFDVAVNNNSTGYASITDSTLCITAPNKSLCVANANGATGTLIVTRSTINVGKDIDLGELNGGSGACTTGYAEFNCSTVNIGQDLMVGQPKGTATLNISGACANVCVNTGLSVGRCGSVSSYLSITNSANVTVNNDNSGEAGENPSRYGDNGNEVVQIAISNGATLTNDAGSNCSVIVTGACTEIIIDGGTHTGTAELRFCTGAVIRGDGCFGDGTWSSPIELRGGTFNDGTLAGDILVLSSSGTDAITQQGNADDLIINGSGTIKLGSSDLIDNSNTNIDINLNGGILDTGGFTQGANNATIGTLTLAANSTIQMDSNNTGTGTYGAHNIFLNGINTSAGSISINGWAGTTGSSGTKGRLLSSTLPAGMAVGDNGGTGYSGISWNGGLYTGTEVLQVTIGGQTFYEIVPFGAVPESHTWIASISILLLIIWDLKRRYAFYKIRLIDSNQS